ncbi:MAG: Bcr/CflA family efflux MFS transporter [Gammaproteobacteria bacterium]|nr:Bcr/CflA family efflux MFS transporter [Gammaproteobacteria bacterium]
MTLERVDTQHNTMRWGFILLLGAVSGLSAFGMASVIPALPVLGRALDANYDSLQFVVSAYLFGLGLFQPIQGLLCDRYGRRPVLLGGFSLFLLASLLASTASSLGALVAARFLQAMGVSVATVASRAIVSDSYPPEPAAIALSFITAVMGVAPVIAPMIGGIAVEFWGWRGIFWLHASAALLLLILLFSQLRETRPIITQGMNLIVLISSFKILLRERSFLGYTLTYGFVSASGFVFITIGASLFHNLFTLSPSGFGALWSSLAITYILGATSAGALSKFFDSIRAQKLGMACNILATILFFGAAYSSEPKLWEFSLALGLLMYANGLISPLSLAGASGSHPHLAGIASGLSSSIAMIISMLSAILTGNFYDGTAHPSAWLMCLLCLCASLALHFAHKTKD